MLCQRVNDERESWEIKHTISLAGDNLIKACWKAEGAPINRGWEMPVAKLLEQAGCQGDDKYAIASNLKPDSDDEIVYIRLTHIWAYADGDSERGIVSWVPMMLRFHEWYVKYKSAGEDIEKLKTKSLFIPNASENDPRNVSYEFLYLKGDTAKQPWTWSRSGGLNGALLYDPARQYFIDQMRATGGLKKSFKG
jgi:hypothetical protein